MRTMMRRPRVGASWRMPLGKRTDHREGVIRLDIYCVKCGEPWEIDYLHDVAGELGLSFGQVRRDFAIRGCQALGSRHGDMGEIGATRAAYASALFDLMGDDVDGIASELDDAVALGFLD